MTTRALPLPLATAVAPLLVAQLLLCGCSPDTAGSPAGASFTTGTASGEADALPSSPAASIAAVVGHAAPAEDFTAEVAEIAQAGSQGSYAAVANFSSAQGRAFEMTVEDSASGQLLANATVADISSPTHSYSLAFNHNGSLSTIVVRLVEKESGREVDRWSPE